MNKKIARRSARGLPAQAPTYLLLGRGYKKERFDPTCQSGERRRGSSTMSNVIRQTDVDRPTTRGGRVVFGGLYLGDMGECLGPFW